MDRSDESRSGGEPVQEAARVRVAGAAEIMTPAEQQELKERARKAFYHSYNSYMTYAYPQVMLLLY